jgi:zinc protease
MHEEGPMILLPVPDDPAVSFQLWVSAGSLDDPPGQEGLAHLTARLVAEGATTRRSYDRILAELYPLAAGYGARVDKEMTLFRGRVHRDHVERFFELYTDAWLRPAFAPADFERLRDEAVNHLERSLRYAADEELGKAALIALVFEGTGYAHPVVGTVAGVRALTVDDVRRFYEQRWVRGNVVPALGGSYDDPLLERTRLAGEALPPGAIPAPAPPPQPSSGPVRVVLVDKPGADASISFGLPLAARRGERDFYALWIANSWLGEHRNAASHLFQVIREQRGLNYGDYSYIEAFPEGAYRQFPPTGVARRQQMFEVWIRTLPNAEALFALRAALREIQRLVDEGLDDDQVELTRRFLSKYVLHFAEDTATRLGYAIEDRFHDLHGEGHLDRFRRLMNEITPDEVRAAVRRHIDPSQLRFAIVTGETEALRRALLSGEPTPIGYESPKPDHLLAEDREIAHFPLRFREEEIRVVPVDEVFAR